MNRKYHLTYTCDSFYESAEVEVFDTLAEVEEFIRDGNNYVRKVFSIVLGVSGKFICDECGRTTHQPNVRDIDDCVTVLCTPCNRAMY